MLWSHPNDRAGGTSPSIAAQDEHYKKIIYVRPGLRLPRREPLWMAPIGFSACLRIPLRPMRFHSCIRAPFVDGTPPRAILRTLYSDPPGQPAGSARCSVHPIMDKSRFLSFCVAGLFRIK